MGWITFWDGKSPGRDVDGRGNIFPVRYRLVRCLSVITKLCPVPLLLFFCSAVFFWWPDESNACSLGR